MIKCPLSKKIIQKNYKTITKTHKNHKSKGLIVDNHVKNHGRRYIKNQFEKDFYQVVLLNQLKKMKM